MPRLRQITCQVEWPEPGLKFEEYGTVYGDGLVETFIAVPDKPQPFSIHLTSKGYIAEGLAVLVYMDGEYQCNRNRLHLTPPKKGQARDQVDVDFRLRQKEKMIGDGVFIGREWRFDSHNIVPNGQFPADLDTRHFDQLGVIEVIVLRCRAKSGENNGSESLTHDSILDEIATLGQTVEDPAAPDGRAGNRQPSVVDAQEEAEELAGLAGIQLDGASDQSHPCGCRGAAGGSGLDGGAPPGYWTYHPNQPLRNNCRTENRPTRRVRFDSGSPVYPPYHPQTGPQGGYRDRPTTDGLLNRQWHKPQSTPDYSEKTGRAWGIPNNTPQCYGDAAPTEDNDYCHHDIPPPATTASVPVLVPVSAPPPWTTPGFSAGGHFRLAPTASPHYPVWTPLPHFLFEPDYPTTPVVYPPFPPVPYGFQGPGYTMSYPIPAAGWPEGHRRRPMNLNPAKEESNRANDSGNRTDNHGWGNTNDNSGAAGNNGQGIENTIGNGRDQNNTNEADNDAWPDDGNRNNSRDRQPANDDNNATWDNPIPGNRHKTKSGENGNNTRNTETQGHCGGNDVKNTQVQGTWDNNANDTGRPPQAQNDWTADGSQRDPQLGPRSNRSLYGPYGAYYSSRPRTTLSPTAEAEEEPPFDVPETIAAIKGTTHQVQLGKGYLYTHKRASPEYIDSIEEPYARFVFKYRTKEEIERQLGIKIEFEPTGGEEKRKFTDKTQDELIELLIRAQNALGGKIPSPPPPAPPSEEGAKQGKSFNPTHKYLTYEPPKGRNPGLGIGGNHAPQAQAQRRHSKAAEAVQQELGRCQRQE